MLLYRCPTRTALLFRALQYHARSPGLLDCAQKLHVPATLDPMDAQDPLRMLIWSLLWLPRTRCSGERRRTPEEAIRRFLRLARRLRCCRGPRAWSHDHAGIFLPPSPLLRAVNPAQVVAPFQAALRCQTYSSTVRASPRDPLPPCSPPRFSLVV